MELGGMLSTFSGPFRGFLATFVIILSLGYFTGLSFVGQTNATNPAGIEENYLGNEEDEEASVMIFKKSDREMLTIIHTHVLSIGFIFFLLGVLVWMTNLSTKLKSLLTIEPFISLVVTFGGLYLMWSGILWMKYIVFLSGILMTLAFIGSAAVVLYQLLRPGTALSK